MVTLEQVHNLARLARIALTDKQATAMQAEISAILSFVERLNKVDTSGLEPTYQVTGRMNITRPDEPIDYEVSTKQLLQNAPQVSGTSIKAKRVL